MYSITGPRKNVLEVIKTPQCVCCVWEKGMKRWISKFRAWSKSLFWMCLALGLWAAPHISGNRDSKFLPQPWSLAAGGITWSTSVQWPKCRFTAAALHLLLQNQSVSGASFPLQFFDLFLYLEERWNLWFSTDQGREELPELCLECLRHEDKLCAQRGSVPNAFYILLSLIHRNCLKCWPPTSVNQRGNVIDFSGVDNTPNIQYFSPPSFGNMGWFCGALLSNGSWPDLLRKSYRF